MSSGRFAVFAVLVAHCAQGAAQGIGSVGRPLTTQEARMAGATVFPDGSGLPKGSGRVSDGRDLFVMHCAACHGARGEGTHDFPALAGGIGSLSSRQPVLTVGSYWPYATTLWDYIRRAMPYARPGSLGDDETYALTAYVLHLSGILDEDAGLDDRSLPSVRMPNRDGFVADQWPAVSKQVRSHVSFRPIADRRDCGAR